MGIIEKLSEKLDIKDIDWRVASINEKGCQLLAYKDARVDMKRLDSVCGALWQSEYKRDSKGVLQCGIGIYIAELKDWVWRWSNGTESFAEAQKGEYSDAFKRAGFMWGIGRELYDVPFTWVKFEDGEAYHKNGKWRTDYKFNPNEWTWEIDFENQKVCAVDKNGKVRVGYKPNNKPNPKPQETEIKRKSFIPDFTIDQQSLMYKALEDRGFSIEQQNAWIDVVNKSKASKPSLVASINGLLNLEREGVMKLYNELKK